MCSIPACNFLTNLSGKFALLSFLLTTISHGNTRWLKNAFIIVFHDTCHLSLWAFKIAFLRPCLKASDAAKFVCERLIPPFLCIVSNTVFRKMEELIQKSPGLQRHGKVLPNSQSHGSCNQIKLLWEDDETKYSGCPQCLFHSIY